MKAGSALTTGLISRRFRQLRLLTSLISHYSAEWNAVSFRRYAGRDVD
jgi:hypothetical protein